MKNFYNDLKTRLDSNEFVKSKDSICNITLKYEQKDKESSKTLHAYADGIEIPLTSQENLYNNGWVQLNNGLIIQYGIVQYASGEFEQIYKFPTSFPHQCFAISGSPNNYYSHDLNWTVRYLNNNQFGIYMDDGGNHTFNYIAIGY